MNLSTTLDIWRSPDAVPPEFHGSSVTIGNFDGIHRGHRHLIERAQDFARKRGGKAVVLTFLPHPMEVLRPEQPFSYLTTFEEKVHLLEDVGVDGMLVMPFDRSFAGISPEAFLDDVLLKAFAPRSVTVGWNFRYGQNRAGDIDLLQAYGETHGFTVDAVPPFELDGGPVSSSRIRELIASGEVARAARLLGRCYSVEGKVQHGAKRGRQIGFPTLNLAPGTQVVPGPGIYAAKVCLSGEYRDSACYIGNRPTFDGEGVLVENHLLDWQGDAYDRTHRVHFIAKTRDDQRFESAEALQQQIARDIENVRAVLSRGQDSPIWPACAESRAIP